MYRDIIDIRDGAEILTLGRVGAVSHRIHELGAGACRALRGVKGDPRAMAELREFLSLRGLLPYAYVLKDEEVLRIVDAALAGGTLEAWVESDSSQYRPFGPPPAPETLRLGSQGVEVRRLQVNLNAAIGKQYGMIIVDGYFGPQTKQAVERYQRDFRLNRVDGVVDLATRFALATRVLVIEGEITRAPTPRPKPDPDPPERPVPFLVQFAGGAGHTPPPFAVSSPGPKPGPNNVESGQASIGVLFCTDCTGPGWQFGGGTQFNVNSHNTSTDPRYTLTLTPISIAYADPYRKKDSKSPFHDAIIAQLNLIHNSFPATTASALALSGQGSVDIIKDKLSLFINGGLVGTWILHDDGGGTAGELQLGWAGAVGVTLNWFPE